MKQQGVPQYLYTVLVPFPARYEKYAHLIIEVRTSQYSKPIVEFSWQAHLLTGNEAPGMAGTWLNGWSDWYCMTIKIDANNLNDLEATTKAARLVLGTEQPWHSPDVGEVLTRLAKKKTRFIEAVYDPRESAIIPLADVKPAEYQNWTDDNIQYGQNHPTLSVMARTEREAQKAMAIALISEGYDAVLAKWIAAGKPVRVHCDRKAPESTRPAIERLHIEAKKQPTMDEQIAFMEKIGQTDEPQSQGFDPQMEQALDRIDQALDDNEQGE